MSLRPVPLWATSLLLVLATFAVGATLKAKERPQTLTTSHEVAPLAAAMTLFTALEPEAWGSFSLAESAIQSLGTAQYVQSGIVEDPSAPGIAYFASTAFDESTEQVTLSLYRYDTHASSYIRLYHASYEQGTHPDLHKKAWPVWHVIGYDMERIIVLVKDGDASLGTCGVPLLFGFQGQTKRVGTLAALSLVDPSSGLMEYLPSAQAVAQAKEAQHACLAEAGK